MMKNAIILMTALIPTTGHADLIEFASRLPETKIHVLINGRSFEPYKSSRRAEVFINHFKTYENVIIRYSDVDDAPQEPEDMPEGFWNWWRDEINSNFPETESWDYVVASEHYGLQVAQSLQAKFLPYDIERKLNPIKGSIVRSRLWDNWDDILQDSRKDFQMKATIFGQESVGKTTISKMVAEELQAIWLHEYARPYLEEVGAEVTLDKMDCIHAGQASLQAMNFHRARTPVIILDTDLFSTIGYHRIMGNKAPAALVNDALKLQSDIYFLMPDEGVPFTPDQLRYGDNERESSLDFWSNILDEYGLSWEMVPVGTIENKVNFICKRIMQIFNEKNDEIRRFQR